MASKDISQRFLLENAHIRGELTRIQESFQQAIANGGYPPIVQNFLGEMITASVLLSSTLKFKGRLSIQAKGDGYLQMIMAECTNDKSIRAIAKISSSVKEPACENSDLKTLLGNGQLAITIHPDSGEQYQGIVPLEHNSLASCLENYFKRSEQIPTRLFLFCQKGRAGGMLLQMLPQLYVDGFADEQTADQWQQTCRLAETLSPEEILAIPSERLLHRLYHFEDVRLFDEIQVNFECQCNHEKSRRIFLCLPPDDIKDILYQQSLLSIQCEFCGTQYEFSKDEIEEMLIENPSQKEALH